MLFRSPLVEVINTRYADPAVIEEMCAIFKGAGKMPVVVKKDVPGFIANRMQHALFREAISIVENGIADAADVDNAIKYTHRSGFVDLAITFEPTGSEASEGGAGDGDDARDGDSAGGGGAGDGGDARDGEIVMRVSDDGMGIAAEDLDQIFELYKQAGQSANRRYRGTGLGLAVVRDLTELHGGTVAVESRVKEGSTFTVRLPVTGEED